MKLLKSKKNISKLMATLMAVSAFTYTGMVSNADSINVTKIAGRDRVETSIKSSSLVNSKIVVVANAFSFADSLSASNLVTKFNAKLLLIGNNTDIKSELKKIKPTKVYIVGGAGTLSISIENSIKAVASNVERVSGSNRYLTNDKTLEKAGYSNVGVADGRNFPDALSASGLLKKKGLGLMLVDGSKDYSTNRNVHYTFGDTGSVKKNAGKRLAGPNRYSTNMAINREIGTPSAIVASSGSNFADALSAINVLNAKSNSAVLLTGSDLTREQKDYIKGVNTRYIVGGALASRAENAIYGKETPTGTNVKPPVVKPKPNTDTPKPPTPNPGGANPSNPTNETVEYSLIVLGREGSTDGEVKKGDYTALKAKIPAGYVLVTTESEFNKFTKVGSYNNKVYVRPQSMKVITSQSEYDRYIFKSLKEDGVNDNEYIVVENVKPNEGLAYLAEGMGFKLFQEERDYGNNKLIRVNMGIGRAIYTRESYDKNKYLSNISKIDKMIQDSGAMNYSDPLQKAYRFGKYLKITYPYNEDINNNSTENHLKSRSPYSLSDYGTAVCEGYTYTFNQAMLRMGIKGYMLEDGIHMISRIKPNGSWIDIDAVGMAKDNMYTDYNQMNDSIFTYNMKSPLVSPEVKERAFSNIEYLYR